MERKKIIAKSFTDLVVTRENKAPSSDDEHVPAWPEAAVSGGGDTSGREVAIFNSEHGVSPLNVEFAHQTDQVEFLFHAKKQKTTNHTKTSARGRAVWGGALRTSPRSKLLDMQLEKGAHI